MTSVAPYMFLWLGTTAVNCKRSQPADQSRHDSVYESVDDESLQKGDEGEDDESADGVGQLLDHPDFTAGSRR